MSGVSTCDLLVVIYHRENRETHRTFEEYCKERWGFARRTAYQFIDSAKVIENVRNCAQIPQTESQARPLTKLPPSEQPMAKKKLPPLFLIH